MMNRSTPLFMMIMSSALIAGACSKRTPHVRAGAVARPQSPTLAAYDEARRSDVETFDPNDPKHGSRRLMGLDTAVFVDGVQVSVLRFGDLPTIPSETLEGGAVRYRLVDYLNAIGLATETIQSIHIHGNNDRIASVDGDELRRESARFQFQFLSGHTGAAVARWDTSGLRNEFVVHEIRKITVYAKKPVPRIDPKRSCHLGADGACTDAVPYASGDAVKGTRIYVDGKMVGFVKRRQLADALVMGETGNGERMYNVAKLVAQMGVILADIRAIELVAGDDVLARADASQFASKASSLYFTLPKHNHGKIRVNVPRALQAGGSATSDQDALISAIHIFKSTKPTARALSAISEDTDRSVQLASTSPSD